MGHRRLCFRLPQPGVRGTSGRRDGAEEKMAPWSPSPRLRLLGRRVAIRVLSAGAPPLYTAEGGVQPPPSWRRCPTAQKIDGLQSDEPKPPKQPAHAARHRCEPERGNEREKPVIPASGPSEEGPDNCTDNGTDSKETK
jgi:hypothetical protein